MITRSCFFLTTDKESEKLEISNEQNQSLFYKPLINQFFSVQRLQHAPFLFEVHVGYDES